MDFMEFIKPELLILIAVLYILGFAIKKSKVLNWKIPFILFGAGIALAVIYLFSVSDLDSSKEVAALIFAGITQGVLTAGVAIGVNQAYKQATTGRVEDSGVLPHRENII